MTIFHYKPGGAIHLPGSSFRIVGLESKEIDPQKTSSVACGDKATRSFQFAGRAGLGSEPGRWEVVRDGLVSHEEPPLLASIHWLIR